MAIQKATIVKCDPRTGRCSVRLESGRGEVHDVLLSSQSADPSQGAGSMYFPKEGVTCHVCVPDDKSRPFVSNYTMPKGADGEGHGGGRFPKSNPGDQVWTSGERSFINLRENGTLEVGSGPMNSQILFPLENMVRNVFENSESISPLGTMKWREGDGKACMVWAFNEVAGGKSGASSVVIKAGDVADGNHAAGSGFSGGMRLEFTVDPGGVGKQWGFHIDDQGQASEELNKSGYLEVRETWETKIGESEKKAIGFGGLTLTSDGLLSYEAPLFSMKMRTTISMESPTIDMPSTNVLAGRGASSPGVRFDMLATFLTQLCMRAGAADMIKDIPTLATQFLKVG